MAIKYFGYQIMFKIVILSQIGADRYQKLILEILLLPGRTVECHLMKFGSGKCNSWIECKQLKYQIQEPLKISYPLHSMVEQQWKKTKSNFVPFLDWGLFTVYPKMQQRHGKIFNTSAAIICHNDELSLSWLEYLLTDSEVSYLICRN